MVSTRLNGAILKEIFQGKFPPLALGDLGAGRVPVTVDVVFGPA